MALRFFKAILLKAFQSTFICINLKMSLLSMLAERGEISVDHTTACQPFKADH